MTTSIDQIKTRGVLRVGIAVDLPGVKEFEADLARLISKELLNSESRVEFIEVQPGERINRLKENLVDLVIYLLTITKERSEQIDFSKPYLVDKEALLVLKKGSVTCLSDLKGKKVAIPIDSMTLENFKKYFPECESVLVNSKAEGVQAVKDRCVEAYAGDRVNLMLLKSTRNDGDLFKIISTGTRFPDKHYAIGIKKGCSDLVHFINSVLTKLENEGSLNNLLRKHGML